VTSNVHDDSRGPLLDGRSKLGGNAAYDCRSVGVSAVKTVLTANPSRRPVEQLVARTDAVCG